MLHFTCVSCTCTLVNAEEKCKTAVFFLLVFQLIAYVWAQLLSGHCKLKEERRKKRCMWRGNPLQYAKSKATRVCSSCCSQWHTQLEIALFDHNYRRLRDYCNNTLLMSIHTLFLNFPFDNGGFFFFFCCSNDELVLHKLNRFKFTYFKGAQFSEGVEDIALAVDFMLL